MSILTKICIVVLVVLILLACPVFITQATEPENWKYKYAQEVERSKLATTSAANDKVMLLSTNQQLKDVKSDLDKARQDAKRDLEAIRLEKGVLETKYATLESELKMLATQLAGLNASLKSEIDRSKQLSAYLVDARKTSDKRADEIIRLTSELRDRMADNQRLTAAERVRVERIYELDEQVADLQSQLRSAGIRPGIKPETTAAVGTDATVTGEITIVRSNLASINIGLAHGVVKGMEMTIYRGGQFVGTIRIEDVSVRTSAGVITQKNLTPVKGDKVTNKLTD